MSEAQPPLEDASDPLEAPAATPPAATGPKPRHKRLATLAGSFLAIIAIASYFYWLMVRDEHTTAQIQKEFKAEGVQVIFSQAEPREEASLSPFQTMSQTVKVLAPTGNLTDELMPRIRDINQDLGLVLNNCPITDKGLASLEGKRNLRWLELRQTKITDEGLKHLRGTDLEMLDVSATKIDDAGLANLGELELPHLKTLVLEGLGHVTDDGIVHLAHYGKLEWLLVGGTKVTSHGVRRLKQKLPSVTILGGT
jgi:hypothetical protein